MHEMIRASAAVLFASLLAAACAGKPADPPPATTPAPTPGGSDYEPCAGKVCGDPCTVCPPEDADCVETMEVKACDAAGTCSSAAPVCESEPTEPPGRKYDPCAGKACGDSCTICAPDDGDCMETMEVKACDASGTCRSSPVDCG